MSWGGRRTKAAVAGSSRSAREGEAFEYDVGAGTIVRAHAAGPLTCAAFVTHFVAKYDKR